MKAHPEQALFHRCPSFLLCAFADEVKDSVYVAGAKLQDGKLLTAGGRVLGVTATAPTLEAAIDEAYKRVGSVRFENAFYRSDIGKRALMAKKGS